MRRIRLSFITAIFLALACGRAYADDLLLWAPGLGQPQFVLPRPTSVHAPENAVKKFLNRITHDVRLKNIIPPNANLQPVGQVQIWDPQTLALKPRVAVLANQWQDLSTDPQNVRIKRIVTQLTLAGADVYVIPPVADLGLNRKEAVRFRKMLSENFDSLLALGGADVDPSLYHQAKTHSGETNSIRDIAESRIIKSFFASKRGPIFGICRGHQLCAVSLGHQMIQDISQETKADIDHRDSGHRIQIEEGTLLASIIGSSDKWVNSIHHQAVLPRSNSALKVVAKSIDSGEVVVEGLESRDGRVLTVQFHPELMDEEHGAPLIPALVEYTKAFREKKSNAPIPKLPKTEKCPKGALQRALVRIIKE